MTGTPRIYPKLKAFFENNPDEELTYEDMLAKCSCGTTSLDAALKQLRRDGVIERAVVFRRPPSGARLARTPTDAPRLDRAGAQQAADAQGCPVAQAALRQPA